MTFTVTEDARFKRCDADSYHYRFDKRTGAFARWGTTLEEDPDVAPAPELVDLEISTVCSGLGRPCSFCYKSNSPQGERMSVETFRAIFAKLPRTVTQIAFGVGDLAGHEDMWRIFDHARANGVVPNVTINGAGLTATYADRLASTMGSVAVSRYEPSDVCYDAVQALTERGMQQVNIHQVVSGASLDACWRLLEEVRSDPRLRDLHAVVFLMLKPKGRAATGMPGVTRARYESLVRAAMASGIVVGFDSCSAPSYLKATERHPAARLLRILSDPCESGLFSIYADVRGNVYPCSFTEGTPGWESGISILEAEDFVRDVWLHPRLQEWRWRLLLSSRGCTTCGMRLTCRRCPVYELDVCREEPR